MKPKFKEWAKRYIPAEIAAAISALAFSLIFFTITRNRGITAYAGALGDIIGFYSYMAIKEISINKDKLKKYSKFPIFFISFRNLMLEFGFSEVLDNLIIRPFLMYMLPIIFGNLIIGIIIAKIAADLVYYVPAIIAYELRKKYLKE